MAEQKLPKQEASADFRRPHLKIPSLSSDRAAPNLKTVVRLLFRDCPLPSEGNREPARGDLVERPLEIPWVVTRLCRHGSGKETSGMSPTPTSQPGHLIMNDLEQRARDMDWQVAAGEILMRALRRVADTRDLYSHIVTDALSDLRDLSLTLTKEVRAEAMEEERAAVVKHLRTWLGSCHSISQANAFADAFERGDHRKPPAIRALGGEG